MLDKATPEIIAAVEQGAITVAAAAGVAELSVKLQREIAANPGRAPTAAKQHRRAEREAELSKRVRQAADTLDTGKRYGVIYADPPWRFATCISRSASSRSMRSHHEPSRLRTWRLGAPLPRSSAGPEALQSARQALRRVIGSHAVQMG